VERGVGFCAFQALTPQISNLPIKNAAQFMRRLRQLIAWPMPETVPVTAATPPFKDLSFQFLFGR
jgi:hypothetical protein